VLDLLAMSPRERIAATRLYLVCDARTGGKPPGRRSKRALRRFLDAALAGGVDLIQLRDKALGERDDGELMDAAAVFRKAADAADALFILNDRPDLVDWCCADGVHVGQHDAGVAEARAAVGPDRIVGRSTHAPEQGAAADADSDVDYVVVGPVHATPTKPGRPAAGLGYVEWAGAHLATPWFAIGGLNAGNVGEVTARGARRIVVVRAITEAADPEAAARVLRERLEEPVGAAQP
jgi:thiamine-phosphate pyrophosphorylase